MKTSRITAIGTIIVAGSLLAGCSFGGDEKTKEENETSETLSTNESDETNSDNAKADDKEDNTGNAMFGENPDAIEYKTLESLLAKLSVPSDWEADDEISKVYSSTDREIDELTIYEQKYQLTNHDSPMTPTEIKLFIESNSNAFENIEFIGYLEDDFLDGNVILAKVMFDGTEQALLVSSEDDFGDIENTITLSPFEDYSRHKDLTKYAPIDF